MKIDKKNHKHWYYLFRSALFIFISIPYRITRRPDRKLITLYGHKLNGNLNSMYEYWLNNRHGFNFYFLTMDPLYYDALKKDGVQVLYLGSLRDTLKMSRSSVIITDHGLHTLILYCYLTKIKFIDVWHGIPFKGFTPENFRFLKHYTEIWVSSENMKQMYESKFLVEARKLKAIGYSRVDRFIRSDYKKTKLISKYGLEGYSKIILIAPTWKQDSKGRSILPFNMSADQFFGRLDEIAKKDNAIIIFRTHLNSSDGLDLSIYKNILFMPYSNYPVAEEFLFISDILISDWSSIVFDYLPLKRPTIFLDVEAPFKYGFSYGPEHRFGKVVNTFSELEVSINQYLKNPKQYLNEFKDNINYTTSVVYGNTLDGNSAERGMKRLLNII